MERLENLIGQLNQNVSATNGFHKNFGESIQNTNFQSVFNQLMNMLLSQESVSSQLNWNLQDGDGFTLLHCICMLGYYDSAQKLIQKGLVNVNILDKMNLSSFDWAVKQDNQQMVELLVDHVDMNDSGTSIQNLKKSPTLFDTTEEIQVRNLISFFISN